MLKRFRICWGWLPLPSNYTDQANQSYSLPLAAFHFSFFAQKHSCVCALFCVSPCFVKEDEVKVSAFLHHILVTRPLELVEVPKDQYSMEQVHQDLVR